MAPVPELGVVRKRESRWYKSQCLVLALGTQCQNWDIAKSQCQNWVPSFRTEPEWGRICPGLALGLCSTPVPALGRCQVGHQHLLKPPDWSPFRLFIHHKHHQCHNARRCPEQCLMEHIHWFVVLFAPTVHLPCNRVSTLFKIVSDRQQIC
jgi:hypothetical protein